MKKILIIPLLMVILLSVVGCRSTAEPEPSARPEIVPSTKASVLHTTSPTETIPPSEMPLEIEEQVPAEGRILVAYFSATVTTKRIAEIIAEQTGADVYQIMPEEPYIHDDLDFSNDSARAAIEQNDDAARPFISGTVDRMEQYDTVLIGYPIWFGQAPRIINTFLESYDFDDKTVVPFCTSGSSGIGYSETNLHYLVSTSVNWLQGERFASDVTNEAINKWIDRINITAQSTQTAAAFDFGTKTVLLNSGYEMPILGMGTYSLSDDECFNSVVALLEAGGRLIDTAYIYGNEASVGRAVRESNVPREEIFVITKIYPSQFSNADAAIEEAIEKLDIGYIDMMMLHHPGENDVEAYKAMERAVEESL